jgi:iron transport multicopper oxidase
VVPLVVDSIQIFAGQRYSFILIANQPFSNYWIRANPSGNAGFDGGINSAILKYIAAPIFDLATPDPTTPQVASINPMLETNLHPLSNPGAPGIPIPGAADVNLNFVISLDTTAQKFQINNFSFVPPTTPVLLQILSGAQAAQDLLPSGSVYVLPRNQVIEISIAGGSRGSPVSSSIILYKSSSFF